METDDNNWGEVAQILSSLQESGFNGVRLPMWPESDQVSGIHPNLESDQQLTWNDCNQYAINVAQRIKDADIDRDIFYGFYVYFAPGYDNRLFQTELTATEYSTWVTKYFGEEYNANFISPFSSNGSNLARWVFNDSSTMEDVTTLFEIDVLSLLRETEEYLALFKKPLIIGPDRGTV